MRGFCAGLCLGLGARMNKIAHAEPLDAVVHCAGHGAQMPGRPHAAGKIKGGIAAGYGLHEAVNGLGLTHVGLCLAEYLRAGKITG